MNVTQLKACNWLKCQWSEIDLLYMCEKDYTEIFVNVLESVSGDLKLVHFVEVQLNWKVHTNFKMLSCFTEYRGSGLERLKTEQILNLRIVWYLENSRPIFGEFWSDIWRIWSGLEKVRFKVTVMENTNKRGICKKKVHTIYASWIESWIEWMGSDMQLLRRIKQDPYNFLVQPVWNMCPHNYVYGAYTNCLLWNTVCICPNKELHLHINTNTIFDHFMISSFRPSFINFKSIYHPTKFSGQILINVYKALLLLC